MEITITKNKIIISLLIIAILILFGLWFVIAHNNSSSKTDTKTDIKTDNKDAQNTNTSNTVASDFVFDVQADPHMDENSDSVTYKQTLANIVSDKPSFLIDLGDIFMVDKLDNKSEENIKNRYTMMKGYYDLLGSIPLYFAMGNHDGEVGWDKLMTKNYRKTYFPSETYEKNYYSFEKSNALFIILDPYTYTTTKPNENGWLWTLGKEQYDWLGTTLKNSQAKYKFVFIHQLAGGDNQGRGGIEMAPYYEWGGKNSDGSEGFAKNRSGWDKPVHQLLVDNGVNIIFKGHDHLFVKQDLDGIVYQTLPQPSHAGDKVTASYNYKEGEILGGSGHICVSITSSGAKVDFVKADSAKSIVYSYSIK